MGSPELLSIAVFGISMVSTLSGNTPLRGLSAACFGLMLAMVGTDPQSGTLRWTMDTLYLWDGLPLVPVTLGIFALPELCDLAIGRMAVVAEGKMIDTKTGMLLGVKDCLRHWFLILRCSWIGAAMGAIPGIGVAVIDWIAYGHALADRKRRGADLRPRRRARHHRRRKLHQCPRRRPSGSRPSPSGCRAAPAWPSCSAPSSFMAWSPARTC